MTEPIALAQVQEAVLDDATLRQLFFDLSQLAEMLEVRLKAGERAYATHSTPTLEAARQAVTAREALAVQLRYRYRNAEWIDTLLRVENGFRLVRVQAPSAPLP
jgi:hypothetical protein